MSTDDQVLLTGATGFVGRALFPTLRDAGLRVRCGSRHPELAQTRFPDRTFVACEAEDSASLCRALDGVSVAFYFIHGMADGAGDYEQREVAAATRFLRAAEQQGVKRIVYLGGLRPEGRPSKHLRSRLRTGEILRSGRVPTTELRASMIVGEGSESFRMVRDIAARLPMMILPRWLANESQPVWIGDVTRALAAAATQSHATSEIFCLPGADRLSGENMLRITARVMGLDPRMFRVPLLSPSLSAGWITLITSANPRVAAELVNGFTSDIVSDGTFSDNGPEYWSLIHHTPLGFEEAVRRALASQQQYQPRTARVVEGLVRRIVPFKA